MTLLSVFATPYPLKLTCSLPRMTTKKRLLKGGGAMLARQEYFLPRLGPRPISTRNSEIVAGPERSYVVPGTLA